MCIDWDAKRGLSGRTAPVRRLHSFCCCLLSVGFGLAGSVSGYLSLYLMSCFSDRDNCGNISDAAR